MRAVADASPLIYLGKVDRLDLLPGDLMVPEEVYSEVLLGEDYGHDDAPRVKAAKGRRFDVETVDDSDVENIRRAEDRLGLNLGEGERAAIAVALETDRVLLSDDSDAKRLARSLGVTGKGTLYLLLRGVKQGELGRDECSELFRRVVESGFWVSPGVADEFHRLLREL